MTKACELASPTSCLNKADHDEPVFVLRAKDKTAPMAIRHWATMARGVHDNKKIEEALLIADEMEKYRRDRYPAYAEEAP